MIAVMIDQNTALFCGIMGMSLFAGGLLGYAIGVQEKQFKQHKEEIREDSIKVSHHTEHMPVTPIPFTEPQTSAALYLRDPRQSARKYYFNRQFRTPQIGQITEAMEIKDIIVP
jgi:hypothetical protein